MNCLLNDKKETIVQRPCVQKPFGCRVVHHGYSLMSCLRQAKNSNQTSCKWTDFTTPSPNTHLVDWQHWSDCRPVLKKSLKNFEIPEILNVFYL